MPTRNFLPTLLLSLCVVLPAQAAAHKHAKPKPSLHYEIRLTPRQAEEGSLRSAWVQLGQSGTLEARAVVDGALCPEVSVDGHDWIMGVRAASDAKFQTVCSTAIPDAAKSAALVFRKPVRFPSSDADPALKEVPPREIAADLDIIPLPLPPAEPQRIVVLGDTGCRIKGKTLQDCSNPDAWPFPQIAAEAARLKPDLVIHVGDYLYRENACPADFAGCQGTPWGDNWPTWDADFFAPAKPLLAAAPWVIVRGNHEDCHRAGPGWLRLLGPLAFDPAAPCVPHLAPYSVPLKGLNLVVSDNADAPEDKELPELVSVYRSEIAGLVRARAPTWFLMHRPIWAAISGPLGIPIGGNKTLSAAAADGIPSPVTLMLAGHIHTFEAINYRDDDHLPPTIVAGFGGDRLDPTPENLKGAVFQGRGHVGVADGLSIGGFGFLLMTKDGDAWQIDVHDVHGRIERRCTFAAGRVDCPKGP